MYRIKFSPHSPDETMANVNSRANNIATKFSPHSPHETRANVKSRANNISNKI